MNDNKTLETLIERLDTIPFLFVGSGFTRRYFDLPDWGNLLKNMVQVFNGDTFAYRYYEDQASHKNNPFGLNPSIASLIETDFNRAWFTNSTIRTLDDFLLKKVKDGCTPFKAEIAQYIKDNSILRTEFKNEVTLFKNISKKSIAGIITTNYDMFFEKYLSDYKVYVGQSELLFSQLHGIAEVYKIHGSISEPDSIVINESDYIEFKEKREYLAAKLLTIFMEYPIIFIGYSLSDANIREILMSIVKCMPLEKLNKIKEKFIFVDYCSGYKGVDIGESIFSFEDGKMLSMIKVTLSDYSLLFNALSKKQVKLPVRLLRLLKDELYEYTLTNKPTKSLKVASIDDERVANDDLVLSIGTVAMNNLNGLKGISCDQWYRNIVMKDLNFSNEDLLSVAVELSKQMSGVLPVNSLLTTEEVDSAIEKLVTKNFEDIISNTIKRNRERYNNLQNIKHILSMNLGLEKESLYIAYLTEDQFNIEDLNQYLISIFKTRPKLFSEVSPSIRTNIRRLIRIFDYLISIQK